MNPRTRAVIERVFRLRAAYLMSRCRAGDLSIAVPSSGNMRPQALNLITGELLVVHPMERRS